MKAQYYMQFAYKTNCDSLDVNNAQHKICLNLEFQKIDSIMNDKFIEYLNTIEVDSIRYSIKNLQNIWVTNRRQQSKLEAQGYRGHMPSIYYISSMIFITDKRLEELIFLMDNK